MIFLGRYPSGQRGQTVNLLALAFGGSNPPLPKKHPFMARILIVDDEPDMVTILKRLLEVNGYEVVVAKTGKEALEKVKQEEIDLVLLDVMLPDIPGYEVSRMLKKEGPLPILLLTARSQKEDFLQGIDAKADDYITKPFDLFRLVKRIKMILEG